MIQHHAHRPCANLRCKLVRRFAHIGSTYSEVGASGKPGAVQIALEEAPIVQKIFDWADAGRGGRWIVKNLNGQGITLRGSRFSNGNLSGILARETYTGVYYDRTADDEGVVPSLEDAIAVPCPVIIDREQFDRVAALRASRNPRRMAPHIAAGTTLLMGLARCGMPGCTSGMTIRTGKSGQYAYYACNQRVNNGGGCAYPAIRKEQLDEAVVTAIERQLLAPDRLRSLLAGLLELSEKNRHSKEAELSKALADKTRLDTAIRKLLILIEDGLMSPRDPHFAERMAENRTNLAAATGRINVLERQLARGKRRIDASTIDRFGKLLSEKLRADDASLRSAYLKMFVDAVSVSDQKILISGRTATLEAGVSTGLPVKVGAVPNFDREWCRLRDSNT
ncbi:hypothetical protein CG471_27445 [Sphingobium sp. IP1]|nr:hypothetical protein CG471_27445 [Sphingobium sp. IP1]